MSEYIYQPGDTEGKHKGLITDKPLPDPDLKLESLKNIRILGVLPLCQWHSGWLSDCVTSRRFSADMESVRTNRQTLLQSTTTNLRNAMQECIVSFCLPKRAVASVYLGSYGGVRFSTLVLGHIAQPWMIDERNGAFGGREIEIHVGLNPGHRSQKLQTDVPSCSTACRYWY
jgi:hypothetical protein